MRHLYDILGLLLSGCSIAKQVLVLVLAPVTELVVGNLVVHARIPLLLDEFICLLPLPEASLEFNLVDVALSKFGTVLSKLLEVTISELSFDEIVHFLGERLGLFLKLWVSRGVGSRILFARVSRGVS